MVVLQHKHSLALIDLNPKYPDDEEVYDDEEDLIAQQAFQCSCDLCEQKITYIHRYYYKCDHCDYSLHILCAELPRKLEHASHSAHTLALFLDESYGTCHTCKSIRRYKQLCYHCSECMFNICLDCGMEGVQYHTIYHPSHQHPLVPVSRQRDILAECDACGRKHEGVFYECCTCFHFFIHNDCAFQSKRLLIQNATRGCFFHTHKLTLSYSFPKELQEAKFYPRCKVCDNSFVGDENFWIYKCEKCRYYTHADCANLRREPSGLNMASKGYEDDPNALHLPFGADDQSYNKIINFLFFKETNHEMTITHCSHGHPLILVDPRCNDTTTPMNKVERHICNGCVEPIFMGMPFYKCTSNDQDCNFALHECCTRLPTKLQGYTRHPQHTLLLLPTPPPSTIGDWLFCYECLEYCNGFAYSCEECEYYVDVFCAFTPKNIRHKSHPHHILSRAISRHIKAYCRMCLTGFRHKKTSIGCEGCQFHLHLGCALLLPETIRHKYDKHPMVLSYGPIENHEGDYFCEVCEEELNPNACFYHCQECVQSMHTTCAPLIPQIKPLISSGSGSEDVTPFDNVKFGGPQYVIKDHPHPLSFLIGTISDGRCNKCHQRMTDQFILKCLQCKFVVHSYHYPMSR